MRQQENFTKKKTNKNPNPKAQVSREFLTSGSLNTDTFFFSLVSVECKTHTVLGLTWQCVCQEQVDSYAFPTQCSAPLSRGGDVPALKQSNAGSSQGLCSLLPGTVLTAPRCWLLPLWGSEAVGAQGLLRSLMAVLLEPASWLSSSECK